MSLCIWPVVETWGESLTYSSRDIPIHDILEALARYADADRGIKDDPTCPVANQYGEMLVVYVFHGKEFLYWLIDATADKIMDRLANDGLTSANDDEYQRQREDVQGIIDMAGAWDKSLDDGALRIYCG